MVRYFASIATMALTLGLFTSSTSAVPASVLKERQNVYAVAGDVTLAGDTVANFACIGLSQTLAAAYAEYLENGVECDVLPEPNDPANIIYRATCQVENDPTGGISAITMSAKENCNNIDGQFDENLL